MILERTITRGGVVLLRFECSSPTPGQCVLIGGRHFVIAHWQDGVGAVVTREGSAIDTLALSSDKATHPLHPVGRGYDTSGGDPVIVTGGLGFAAGLSLVQAFLREGRSFRMLALTRDPSGLRETLERLGLQPGHRLRVWDTASQGRPSTPLDPLDAPLTPETPLLFAGPSGLHDGLRSALDKSGRTNVRIRLNY